MNLNHLTERGSQCDAIQELIPDYAFGLTNPEETHFVESSLASCPDAAAQLADFQRLQENLRLTVPQVEPPVQLADKLMAAIAAPAPIVMPRSRKLPLAWLAAAAVLALLLTNLYWFFRVNDLTQQRNQLTALLNGQGNKAFVLTGTDNLRWVRLPPSQEDSNTSAFMMWNERSDVGLLYAHAFPALTPGRTYQLWLTNGKERISAGTFHVDEEGKGAMLFHINEPIDGYTWARITAEPDSGSNAPSDSVVVIGELPSS